MKHIGINKDAEQPVRQQHVDWLRFCPAFICCKRGGLPIEEVQHGVMEEEIGDIDDESDVEDEADEIIAAARQGVQREYNGNNNNSMEEIAMDEINNNKDNNIIAKVDVHQYEMEILGEDTGGSNEIQDDWSEELMQAEEPVAGRNENL